MKDNIENLLDGFETSIRLKVFKELELLLLQFNREEFAEYIQKEIVKLLQGLLV